MEDHLWEQSFKHRTLALRYVKISTSCYRIEVPADATPPPTIFKRCSDGEPGYVRYTTDRADELLGQLARPAAELDASFRVAIRSICARFDASYSLWVAAVRSVATLDALLSLASYSASCGGCTPLFVDTLRASSAAAPAAPMLRIRNGRHPCLRSNNFVRNDTELTNERRIRLIMGPTAGGKTTHIRQVGLIVILAQLGTSTHAYSTVAPDCDSNALSLVLARHTDCVNVCALAVQVAMCPPTSACSRLLTASS